jgi:hypothetical protein
LKTFPSVRPEVPSKYAALTSIVLAVLAVILIDLVISLSAIGNSYLSFAIAAAIFFVFALAMGRMFEPRLAVYLPLMMVGIGVGTFVDAILRNLFHLIDANLWPLAAVMYWVLAVGPVMVGLLLGERWRHRQSRGRHKVAT